MSSTSTISSSSQVPPNPNVSALPAAGSKNVSAQKPVGLFTNILPQRLQSALSYLSSNYKIPQPTIIETPLQQAKKDTSSVVIQASPESLVTTPLAETPTAPKPVLMETPALREAVAVTPQEGIATPAAPAAAESANAPAAVKEEARPVMKIEEAPSKPAPVETHTTSASTKNTPEPSFTETTSSKAMPKLENVAKGAAMGIAGPVVTAPLDARQRQRASQKAHEPKPPLKAMFNNYGKVLKLSIPGKVIGSVAFMSAYPTSSAMVDQITNSNFLRSTLPFGGCAVVAAGVETPVSVIGQGLQLAPKGATIAGVVRSIHASEGVKGFYRGTGPQLTASVVYNMIFFPGSKATTRFLESLHSTSSKTEELFVNFSSGLIVGSAAVPVTYPIYRVIIDQRNQRSGTDNPPKSFVQTSKEIVQRGVAKPGGPIKGVLSEAYKGAGATIPRMGLLGATIVLVNEAVRIYFEDAQEKPKSS